MAREGATVVGVVIVACALLQACAKKHSPQDSTETGNPPVIDAERVALVVQDDEVHVVGGKGAVKPGSVTIRVTNLVSDKRTSGRAAKDGSFDVKAAGHVTDGFSVQASNGDGESKPVFVTQTSAAAAEGDGGTLSCDQQRQLARDQVTHTIEDADKTCTQAGDCVTATIAADCYSKCGGALASASGKAEIEATVAAVDQGLCRNFKSDGCPISSSHCASPGTPACVAGQCVYELADGAVIGAGASDAGASDAGALSCDDRVNMATAQWFQAVAEADKTCSVDGDCMHAPGPYCALACFGDPVSAAGLEQVLAVIDAIEHGGVCTGFETECDGGGGSCPASPMPICNQGRCQADLTCDDRSNTASAELQQAVALADNHCSTNADCMFAPASVDCFPGCTSTAISTTGHAQVQAAIAAINAGVCAGFTDDGCIIVDVPPCVPPRQQPTCNQGRCEPKLDCTSRFEAAQTRLNQVAVTADKSCTKDVDCDFAVSAADCHGGCGYGAILSAAGRAQVDAAIAELNAGVCENFDADGCMAPMPSCPGPPTPICTQGQCTGTPAP